MSGTITLHGVRKAYGPVVALEALDFEIRVGEVVGLVGQNGSGKSTLLKILSGLALPDSGEIRLDGEKIVLDSAAAATRYGIGMVHQEQSLIPNLTVAENIFLDKAHASKRMGLYRWSSLNAAARAQLDKLSVDIPTTILVEDLRFSERQQVEFAKVLAIEEMVDKPPLILFDEPTSLLTPDEIRSLFAQINRLRARASIVFVSHRLEEVLEISDRVIVLTDGRKMAERSTSSIDREELYELMVGRQRVDPAIRNQKRSARESTPLLEVNRLTSHPHFRDVTLRLGRGEILGIVGVLGSGAEELCRAIFGVIKPDSGDVLLDGKVLKINGPRSAVRQGIGYLPANRRAEGMLPGRSLTENAVITFGSEYGWRSCILNRRREREVAQNWMSRLKVKMNKASAAISSLSGGNQQKIVLAKWLLAKNLRLLLLDHPSRGLDPGARDDLFEVVREQVSNGLSVIFVADTIAELLDLSDRIVVMRDGEVTAQFEPSSGTLPREEEIVAAMV
ncbi:sugar ABC transporter ATP-binding protein [Lichenicola cladoniae]|uniref:Sugar ABC transporter ATP-binding protein n=1 Tax=Lichenicola cladoniae TaxID=1484109 RepID=A0A6M8HLY7_9PROT|nr:sugar ABC transporter ATP-binding protein [Lichenicola cladoniae]NPD69927.1 sugar ABC transporter ATP-binding protein [Acetobacteraceae bacterium]QKE89347.1 sugar ABC transporter ATP-binding protein [Lichenicola cladoniae]